MEKSALQTPVLYQNNLQTFDHEVSVLVYSNMVKHRRFLTVLIVSFCLDRTCNGSEDREEDAAAYYYGRRHGPE